MHALFHGKIKKIVKLPNFPWDDILPWDRQITVKICISIFAHFNFFSIIVTSILFGLIIFGILVLCGCCSKS